MCVQCLRQLARASHDRTNREAHACQSAAVCGKLLRSSQLSPDFTKRGKDVPGSKHKKGYRDSVRTPEVVDRVATHSQHGLAFLPLAPQWPQTARVPERLPARPHHPGQRIRQRRMDLGLTQHTLAAKLRCNCATVAAWEKSACVPLSRRWPGIETLLGRGLMPKLDGLPGRVRTGRLRLGLTQRELAYQAGVHVRTVRNTERGTHAPSPDTLQRLEAVFGEKIGWGA